MVAMLLRSSSGHRGHTGSGDVSKQAVLWVYVRIFLLQSCGAGLDLGGGREREDLFCPPPLAVPLLRGGEEALWLI